MSNQDVRKARFFSNFVVFILIFGLISVLFGVAIWFFSKPSLSIHQAQALQTQATVSPLLFGNNLALTDKQVFDANVLTARLEQLHIRMLRLTIQKGISNSTLQQVVSLLKNLDITPLVSLHFALDPTTERADVGIVTLINTIYKTKPVYYEYGDEEDAIGITANSYTNSWNATIVKLAQIDSAARFIGPATYHYDSDYLHTFLTRAQPQPYAVSWHEFTCDTSSSEGQCLTNITTWTHDITSARNIMGTSVGGIFPIMITEWNYAANATLRDGKSNDSTFMTNWTTQALHTLIDSNVFASMQYSPYSQGELPLLISDTNISAQDKAFQTFSAKYANVALSPLIATSPETLSAISSAGTIVDNLNDWSNTFTHTSKLTFDTANSQGFNNDVSRVSRSLSKGHEEVVWQQPAMTSFTVITYFWSREPVSPFSIYASSNGSSWQPAFPEITHDMGSWYQYIYALPHLSNVNYVKLRWNNTGGQSWSPQISKVVMTYNSATTTVDNLNDWGKTSSHTSHLTFDTSNSSAFNDDISRAVRAASKTHEEIVWKQNKLTFVQFITYFWSREPISPFTISVSTDESTWQEVLPTITNVANVGKSWQCYMYTLNNLSNANFVKIRWNNTTGQSWSPQISRVVLVR